MKYILLVALAVCLSACSPTNDKLSQKHANEAVWQFMANHRIQGSYGGETRVLSQQEIGLIEPVSQFSENEATVIVNFNYEDFFAAHPLVSKFTFKRDMDKNWLLVSVESVRGEGSTSLENWSKGNRNLSIMVQPMPKKKFLFW